MKKNYLLILYGLLLFSLLTYPHILANHILLIKNTAWVNTIINFIIISIGILIYIFNQQEINLINRQKNNIEGSLEMSYKHIGIMNGGMDSLKETVKWISKKQRSQKEIIHKLLFIINQSEKFQIRNNLFINDKKYELLSK